MYIAHLNLADTTELMTQFILMFNTLLKKKQPKTSPVFINNFLSMVFQIVNMFLNM